MALFFIYIIRNVLFLTDRAFGLWGFCICLKVADTYRRESVWFSFSMRSNWKNLAEKAGKAFFDAETFPGPNALSAVIFRRSVFCCYSCMLISIRYVFIVCCLLRLYWKFVTCGTVFRKGVRERMAKMSKFFFTSNNAENYYTLHLS